ncbi:MAG TPA: E3 binding domain-containing protein, partial [Capillimicrobium sp.]
MTEITMPRLSDSMEEGTILSWLVEDGHPVAVGDELVEIETDKATATHVSDAAGVLRVVAPAGTTLPVGGLIARVGEPADDDATRPSVASGTGAAAPAIAAAAGSSNGRDRGRSALATPLARRVAAAHGVALDELTGSGPRGRVTRADVLAAAGRDAEPPRQPRPPLAPTGAPAPEQVAP